MIRFLIQRFPTLGPPQNRKKVFSLLVFLLLTILVPVSVYLVKQQQDIRSRAQETDISSLNTPSQDQKPEYVQGEILIKFRRDLQLRRKGVSAQAVDLNRESIRIAEVEEDTLPRSLRRLNEKYPVNEVEKVFKGVGSPQEEMRKLESKLSKEEISPKGVTLEELELVDLSKIYKLSFDQRIPVEAVVGEIRANPDILYAEPNYIYKKTQLVPNDPYYLDRYPDNTGSRDPSWNPSYDYQWNLKRIGMQEAWNLATPSAQILVAVIDTGVDYTHPELGECTLERVNNNQCPKVAPGFNFVNNDADPQDDEGHGTHVAGIIASMLNNQRGIAGMSPNAKIIPLKGLDGRGRGQIQGLARAIYGAVTRGARVINASWGGPVNSQTLTDAITFAYVNDVIFVAAAGNSNRDVVVFSPANVTCATQENLERDCVITVASIEQNDQRSSFSNWGTMIDLAAPGGDTTGNVLSLKSRYFNRDPSRIVGLDYARMSGTSMAAPHVSALVAMVWGKNEALTNDEVRNIVINGADDLGLPAFDIWYGYGRINAERALRGMDSTTPPIARISSPLEGLMVGRRLKIYGSSNAVNFSRFLIEHSNSPESTLWSAQGVSLEGQGRSPVRNGLLATINLSGEPEGRRYFRLTTYTNDGRGVSAMISLQIDGSVRDGFPLTFGSDTADQKPVIADLNNDGQKEIIFENSNEGKLYVIEPDGTNLAGWPQPTSETRISYSPLIVDIDPSYPGFEIILPTLNGSRLLAFHSDGSMVSGWGWGDSDWQTRNPLGHLYWPHYGSISSVSINGQNTVIFAEQISRSSSTPPKMHVLDRNGNELPGWPVTLEENAVRFAPIAADLDNDGNSEIIVNYFNNIRIYANNGILRREIQISNNRTESRSNGDFIENIAAADIDRDGFVEVIALISRISPNLGSLSAQGGQTDYTTTAKVFVWDYQGNVRSGFPYQLQQPGVFYPRFLSIGDYTSDQNVEILIYFLDGRFYALDKNGSLLRGFPTGSEAPSWVEPFFAANATLSDNSHLTATSNPQFFSSFSNLDIYRYNSGVGLWRREGSRDFSANFADWVGFPSTLDLDGDNRLEVVVPVTFFPWGPMIGYLYVFNLDYQARFLDWPQYLHDERHTGTYVGASLPLPSISLPISPKIPGIGNMGRENRSPLRSNRLVNLEILDSNRNQTTTTSTTLAFDGNNFAGTAQLGNIPQGSYYIKVKLDNSLFKFLNNGQPINITPGTPIATQSATMIMGNLNNDDVIDISDFVRLRQCFASRTTSSNWSTCQIVDFNDDGRITVTDYSRLVTNFLQRGE